MEACRGRSSDLGSEQGNVQQTSPSRYSAGLLGHSKELERSAGIVAMVCAFTISNPQKGGNCNASDYTYNPLLGNTLCP